MNAHTEPHHRWYTVDEAAAAAAVTPRTIRRWIARRLLTVRDGHINAEQLFDVERERRNARNPGRPGPRVPTV